jgi:hypothetical protein
MVDVGELLAVLQGFPSIRPPLCLAVQKYPVLAL